VGLGGGYDRQGTAASVLEGVSGYFRQRGVVIAEVPPELRHDPRTPQRLYTELWQTARNGDVLQGEDGSPRAVWRHDDPALGRIGVLPRVPPGHEAWLDEFWAQVAPELRAAGYSPQACERIGAGCVCQAAGQGPAHEPPRFLLSKDGGQIGVLHRSGQLQEIPVQHLLANPQPEPGRGPEVPPFQTHEMAPRIPTHEPVGLSR